MLVVQFLSLSEYSPLSTLIFISFNLCFLVAYFFDTFLFSITHYERRHIQIDPQESEDPLSSFPYQSLNGDDDIDTARPFPILWIIVLPLFTLSILYQTFTIVGIPHFLRSVRKALAQAKKETRASEFTREREAPISLIEAMGMFLIPLNLLFFLFLMLLILPFGTTVLAGLWVAKKLEQKKEGSAFDEFRLSCQLLVAYLFLCYFPYFSSIPELRKRHEEAPDPPLWKAVISFLWLFLLRFGLPLSDVITDLLFSLQLLWIWSDENLGGREELLVWLVISFLATGVGFILSVLHLWLDIADFFKVGLSMKAGAKKAVHKSPFGTEESRRFLFVKGGNALFEDFLQIIVSANTLGFVGQIGGLWGLKLTVSLISSSYTLSKVFVPLWFYQSEEKRLKIWTQLSLFCLFSLSLSGIISATIQNDFCSLSRSVRDASTLQTVAKCDELSETVFLRRFEGKIGTSFSATSVQGFLVVEENEAAMEIAFSELESLGGSLLLSDNRGSVNLTFSKMSTLLPGSSLEIKNNSNMEEASFPFLTESMRGARIEICDAAFQGDLVFPSWYLLEGEALFCRIAVERLVFFNLVSVEGTLVVEEGKIHELLFPSLTSISGEIEISNTIFLQNLSLPLRGFSGSLKVAGNQNLKTLSFRLLNQGAFSLLSNPSLSLLQVGYLSSITRNSIVSDNSQLEEISFDSLISTSFYSLEISWNEKLKTLWFRGLNCMVPSKIFLLNNVNLETVYVPLIECDVHFISNGNPKLIFRKL